MLNHDDLELTRAVERCEIPTAGFPHAFHLRVAWVYLHECSSLDDAIARMSSTLRKFSAAAGQAEKFSEPTTVFWMLQVAAARAVMPDADLDAVLRAFPRLLDKNLIRPDEATHVTAPDPADSPSDAPDRSLHRRSA